MGLENYRRSVSEAKRAAILKAGRSVFLRDGFSRAAVADIAHDADVSTATLYKHFSSKEVLFAAVVRDAVTGVQEFAEMISSDASVADVFLSMGRSYLATQFEYGANDLLRIVISEAVANPELAREVMEFTGERRARLSSVLAMLVERKLLKPHDTELGAKLLTGMIKELYVWPALFDLDYRLPDNVDEGVRALTDVYLARYGA